MRSATVDLDGPLHLAEWGDGEPAWVLVHGLGGSHANWMSVAPRLAARGGVLAPDLPGFGLSPVAGRRGDLASLRRVLHRILVERTRGPVILMGNSMGGLLAMAEAGLHPERVTGLVLVDAVLPVPWRIWPEPLVTASFVVYAIPPLGRRLLRRALDRHRVEEIVAGAFALCTVDPERIDGAVRAAHIEVERSRQEHPRESDRAFADAARSIVLSQVHSAPTDRLLHRVRAPTLVIHGARDRLVSPDAARRAGVERPDWRVALLDEVGHIPMLETPALFLSTLEAWLDAHRLAPAGGATPAPG
jgi:pimeloyl-ACP methyl ester carboxylesterase